jgi:para-nitrobenzyl esterase
MSGNRLDRREIIGLAAAGAVALGATPALSAAQKAEDKPKAKVTAAPGSTETGPGVPVTTKVVQTKAGPVQGLVIDGVNHFKGVRYGKAPIGSLRFMPPRPAEPWTAIYDATDFGAPAMQLASGTTVDTTNDFGMQMHRVFTTPSDIKIQNEDCLFLNVWTPAPDAKKRPVMVWIHGGGFAYGSGSQPIYQGDGLAKFGDVVVVSVNHRLNLFGYLNLAEAMGPDYASSGTVGMQDLVLALQWVRDNIAAFGGDPGNVMIMGQSGGGQKVSILCAMPSAKGLFHKAAIQSGPGLAVGRPGPAAAAAKRFLDALGVKPGDRAALEAIPAPALIAAAAKMGGGPGGGGVGGGPIVDGVAIPRDPFTPDAPDVSADVPIMVGWAKDEWTIFTAGEPWFGKMTEADLQARVKPMGENGQKLLSAIRAAYPTYSPTYLWVQMISVRVMQGSETLAERKAAQGRAPAFVYTITWETPASGGVFKTPHTMEIPFMLYNFDRVRTFVGPGPEPKHMADQIAGAWVAFARTGKPDHAGIPHWPPFDARTRPVMDFNLKSRVVSDPLPDVRQALNGMTAPPPRG